MFNTLNIDKCFFDGQEATKTMLNGANIRKYRFQNLLGVLGNFAADSDSNGFANGWRSEYAVTSKSVSNNVQTYLPAAKYGNLSLTTAERTALRSKVSNGDVIYACAWIKTADNLARVSFAGVTGIEGAYIHSGSGEYEFCYIMATVSNSTSFNAYIETFKSADWVDISVRDFHVFKQTHGLTSAQKSNIMKCRVPEGGYLEDEYIQINKVPLGTVSNLSATTGLDAALSATAVVPTNRGGIVMCVDDVTFPRNCVTAYIDRTYGDYIYLDKYVNGKITNLIAAAITYVDGQSIKIEKVGKVFKLYYNDVQIGTDQTIGDMLIYNKNYGTFEIGANTDIGVPTKTESESTYLSKFIWGSDMHIGHEIWGATAEDRYNSVFDVMNKISDASFLMFTGDILENGYSSTPEPRSAEYELYEKAAGYYLKPIYPFTGNHDIDVSQFINHGVVDSGGVKIIYFHADYIDETHGGNVSESELTWLETQLQEEATHKILACHYTIASSLGQNIGTGHDEIVALANTYGAQIYLSGHTHTPNLPTATDGVLTNIAGAGIMELSPSGQFMVCEVYADKIVVDLYLSHSPFSYVKSIEVSLI